ncbi:MAG: hypothetical protein R3320_05145 [Nitriliruptorales bacterium]|nr:hypothetical protein [Nitriliruptorales bacterium]
MSGDSPATGVQFPIIDGSRSTTATGTRIFARVARELSPGLAENIESEDDWRHNYIHHLRRITEAELADPEASSRVPEVALRSLHEALVFVRAGRSVPLDDATKRFDTHDFDRVTIEGTGDREEELAVPYEGRTLRGDKLREQLSAWVESGICEPSFATAIRRVVDHPEWLRLDDRRFVLLGAGAELGPLTPLARWGAHVTAVDIPSERVWQRIIAAARGGCGSLDLPARKGGDTGDPARAAGADLTTDMPEIAAWLSEYEGPLVVGNYVYADGADNVRVSAAVDAIIDRLARGNEMALAVLATPTDVYAVPKEAAEESRRRYEQRGRLARTMATVSRGQLYAPNYRDDGDGGPLNVADAQVPQQGPNYALAKHLHRWRAREARSQGMVSSVNVAPPTRTHSVTKNRLLAAAYRGAPRFDVEVFEPDTANSLMAAMLVHDLSYDGASSQPHASLDHPLELLTEGANHGGLWRVPFAARSVLGLAAIGGLVRGGG